jgi:phosphoserine phosphatase
MPEVPSPSAPIAALSFATYKIGVQSSTHIQRAEKQHSNVTHAPTPPILSTADFHDAVLALSPTIAVFDCDGTLWSGDAGTGFMNWTIERGLLSREATDWLDARYRAYLRGEVSELAICGEMVQVYHGLREQELRLAAAQFFAEKIAPNIFPEMLALIRELQSRNVDIWAVSSTNDWVIEEGVRRFGIPPTRVLSARVSVANGLVTDILLDVPTDEGKVASLARAGITAPHAVFGNSIHDAAMLAAARSPKGSGGAFPVNPTPALLERSATEGWPIYYPASVAPSIDDSKKTR